MCCIFLFRSNFPRSDRQSHLYMAVLWIVIVITFLTFLVSLLSLQPSDLIDFTDCFKGIEAFA